jgi:glycosyltransferase involved in cell wall biosynthesis
MPSVSVIIPTYNRPFFLRSAIESVFNQTFQDFEIIVVDDASDCSAQELLSGFKDIRLRYIRHDYNKGEAASRNTGITNSSGEFLAFLDDDDEWLPDKLTLQVDLLEKAPLKVGAVYTGVIFANLSDNSMVSQSIPTKRGNILKDMLIANVVGTPSKVLIRRSCIEKVGLFDENLPYYVDYDYFLRFAKQFHFDYIPMPLVKYFLHNENLTKNASTILKALEYLKRKYSGDLGSEKLNHSFYNKGYLYIGTELCYSGNINEGRKYLIMSIKYNPYNYRSYFNILISFLGKNLFTQIINIKAKICGYLYSAILLNKFKMLLY